MTRAIPGSNAAVALPAGVAMAAGQPPSTVPVVVGGGSDDSKRFIDGSFANGMVEGAIFHVYDVSLGPWIRQHTQSTLHQKYTPAYKPPNTPGMVAREELNNWVGNVAFGGLLGWLTSNQHSPLRSPFKPPGGINLATAPGGASAINAQLARMAPLAEQTTAARRMLGVALVYQGCATLWNAMVAAHIGPYVEDHVNELFGVKAAATVTTNIRGGVPASTVKQDFEQASRLFGRSLLVSVTNTVAFQSVGLPIKDAVKGVLAKRFFGIHLPTLTEAMADESLLPTAMEGASLLARALPGVAGFAAATAANTAIIGVVNWAVGGSISNTCQRIARLGETLLHKPLAQSVPPDIVPTPGDRASTTVENTLIPAVLAFGIGGATRSGYLRSL